MALSDAFVRGFKDASATDNAEFMSGRIDHDEFWRRVHARDAQVRAMTPQERQQIND